MRCLGAQGAPPIPMCLPTEQVFQKAKLRSLEAPRWRGSHPACRADSGIRKLPAIYTQLNTICISDTGVDCSS